MREIKFKVYYEAEINGEKLKGIEEPCSWFLLTQTGQIMEYGPVRPPSRPHKGYTKLIPLFYTGLKDKNGKEIYEGDIVELAHTEQSGSRVSNLVVEYLVNMSGFYLMKNGSGCHLSHDQTVLNGKLKHIEVIGNIYENPELLENSK